MKVNRVDFPPLTQAMKSAIFLANTSHVINSASSKGFQLQVPRIYLTAGSLDRYSTSKCDLTLSTDTQNFAIQKWSLLALVKNCVMED